MQAFLLLQEITPKEVAQDTAASITGSSVSVNHLTALWHDKIVLNDVSFDLDKVSTIQPFVKSSLQLFAQNLSELQTANGLYKLNAHLSIISIKTW